MANIDPYVEQIANARYGKDVRQSIIDALVAMNAEIMGSGVVTFNGRNGEVVPTNGDYDISQISATNGLQGQVPTVNSHGGFILQSPGASALNDLSDVTLTSPTSGQVLKYDGNKWINGAGGGGGGGGTTDYLDLENKPQINSVTLSGNKSLADLGITNGMEAEKIWENDSPNSSFAQQTISMPSGITLSDYEIMGIAFKNAEDRFFLLKASKDFYDNVHFWMVRGSTAGGDTGKIYTISRGIVILKTGSGAIQIKDGYQQWDGSPGSTNNSVLIPLSIHLFK